MFNYFKLGLATLVAATIVVGGCGGGNGPSAAKTQSGSIVFDSDKDSDVEGDSDIYRMNPDGSNVRRLTNNSPINDFGAELSPDGRTIAYISAGRPGDGASGAQIYLMDLNGNNVRQLTNNPGYNAGPRWSSDGHKILFSSAINNQPEVYLINLDGSGQINLTRGEGGGGAVFNGDNSKILFSSYRGINDPTGRSSPNLYVMDADGSNVVRFTLSGESGPVNPGLQGFSPDGRQLLISAGGSFQGGGPQGIFVANADGTSLKQIANSGGTASWSPDGNHIAFSRYSDNGHQEIYAIRADGTDLKQLTQNNRNNLSPSWR